MTVTTSSARLDGRSASSTEPLPRITIVTPSFNQGQYLEAAMRSVLEQGYPNLEYIVLDGGSTDGSAATIERFAPHLAYWRTAKDGGQADAIATGFRRATGDILAWLNSDDLLLPGALARVAQEFSSHPSVGLVYGSRLYVDERGECIGAYAPPTILNRYYFSFGQWLPQECTFWRRSAYDRCGGVDASLYFAMDYSLFTRLWSVTHFRRIPAVLGAMRLHPEAKTARSGSIMNVEGRRIRSEQRIPECRWRLLNLLLTRAIYAQAWCESKLDRLSVAGRASSDDSVSTPAAPGNP